MVIVKEDIGHFVLVTFIKIAYVFVNPLRVEGSMPPSQNKFGGQFSLTPP
jgi:hypothetical protein